LVVEKEIPIMLVDTVLFALKGASITGLMFAVPIVARCIVVGSGIALAARAASKRLPAAEIGADISIDHQDRLTVRQLTKPSVLAGFVAGSIVIVGLMKMGFVVFTLWTMLFVKLTFPWIAGGAALGVISRHWAWCVAVSLPLGLLLSDRAYDFM